ncbi:acyclic terpene utilization AtuA family protein [Variovorax sp. PBL-E5]|uniref:acyclic terpene utilization AtuA family protein n=1 Tax=Variovorax sp. PBL-E5 TaxID=434014 RepID=UPI001316E6B9|nr:acyclic terpene utilization AtuA family protein [Variovorax sp. PBL-E5]VTU23137.1 hypothetical protein E5CHR_01530 [Variovorax sp. PBL-E5]
MQSSSKVIRIGCASGFWGDSAVGAPQLVQSGQIDYLVFDYLAETTMAILAAARLKKPDMGYATDFVEITMRSVIAQVLERGIKVVSNAGGIHPAACAQALGKMAQSLGLAPRIAVVEGDDVSGQLAQLEDMRDMFSGEPVPASILSANAYLGAFPIARALAAGADIVITGRIVDSAATLGPLIHEFGWQEDDFDRLAAGSLAGHLIECGCQATGGLHTDWREIPDWAHIGYPIVECEADGSFRVTKPKGTGGRILRACVAEQLLYEIGDPASYLLPDVTCDFREVRLVQLDDDHVGVTGARGRAPGPSYKVSATRRDGWRCTGSMVIVGREAEAKARRTGEAIIERTRAMFRAAGLEDYSATRIDLFGTESLYGAAARGQDAREIMLRVIADHPQSKALELFAREIAASATSWSPGTTSPGGGRPSPSPLVRPFAFLLDKQRVPVRVVLPDGTSALMTSPAPESIAPPAVSGVQMEPTDAWSGHAQGPQILVPLIRLAWARSGDKGDLSNIGLIARKPEWAGLLWRLVTPERVKRHFAHLAKGAVERFYLPGVQAINFVLHEALDGGGPASTRIDPLGKGMGQILLDLEIEVPAGLLDERALRDR